MAAFRLQKGGNKVGKTKRDKGSKVIAIVTKKSRLLAVSVFPAIPFESTLLEQTIHERFSKAKISRLVGTESMTVTC